MNLERKNLFAVMIVVMKQWLMLSIVIVHVAIELFTIIKEKQKPCFVRNVKLIQWSILSIDVATVVIGTLYTTNQARKDLCTVLIVKQILWSMF